jgi:type I restriction enzyme S subunit
VLRATEVIEPEWIFYCISSDQFIKQITPLMRGANYPAVTDKDILGASIPLPSATEQRRIINCIEACMERVEEIEELRTENHIMACSLYKSRLIDLFTEMISGAPVHNFEDIIADTKLGLVRSKKEQSNDLSYPYVRMQDIINTGTLNTSALIKVEASDREVKTFSLRIDDFLFNTRNSYELVGKTAIVRQIPKQTLFNNNIMRIRFKDIVLPAFMNHLFQHEHVRSQLEARKNKTTSVCAIYWKGLSSVKIPVPPIQKQKDFVTEIDSVFNPQKKILVEIESSSSKHSMLRDSILRKAFAGEL